MKILLGTAHRTGRWMLRCTLTLIFLIALVLTLGPLVLPQVTDYRADLEQRLGDYLRVPVRIESLEVAWAGWGPVLRVDGFSLLDPGNGKPLAGFDQTLISLDVARTLRAGSPVPSHVRLEGLRLILERGADGSLRLVDRADGGAPIPIDEWLAWLFAIRSLDLIAAELVVRDPTGDLSPLSFKDLRLSLREAGGGRRLGLALNLAESPGKRLQAVVDLQGESHDPGSWGASFYLRGEALQPARMADEPTHVEVWGDWQRAEGVLHLDGLATELRLEALAAWGAPWLNETQNDLVNELKPQGAIPELLFRLAWGEETPRYILAARLEGVDSRGREHLPGMQGLAGRLYLDQDGGRLELDTGTVRVDTGLLRTPAAFDTLTGIVQWRHQAAGLHLAFPGLHIANADLDAYLRGGVTWFRNGAGPHVDLRLDCRDLSIERVAAYLPAALMKPRLVAWLDRALVSGRVVEGNLALHGDLADFPFARDEGLFEARLRIQDAILDYGIGWPPIEELEAELVFRNDTFQVHAESARIFDVDLERIHARIGDLPQGLLEIRGHARGAAASMVRFLRDSPLAGQLGEHIGNLQLSGDNTLDLALAIPFDGSPVQIQGRVNFTGSNLTLPEWGLSLERIQGGLDFSEQGLATEDLQVQFRGAPVRLDIDTLTQQSGHRETRFRLHGKLGPEALLGEHADQVMAAYGQPALQGKAHWDVVLRVRPADPAPFALSLASDLQGMAMDLPSPFGKSPGDKRDFAADVRMGRDGRVWVRLDYAPEVRAMLEFLDFPDHPRLGRGELRINTGPASLPEVPGLTVVAHLPRLELPALVGGATQADTGLPWLTAVDAYLEELVLGGQRFSQVYAQVRNREEALRVELEGETLAGRLFIPHRPSPKVPVGVEMRRLMLAGDASGEEMTAIPDPRELPPLWMVVEDLVLDGRSLGKLRLSMTPHEEGLRLTSLELHSALHRLNARGDWLIMGGEQLSRLQASLHSQNLGETLRAFGYAVGLEGGETRADLRVIWPAPFPEVSPGLLSGRLSLQIGKGQLLELRPGVGRIVGLFSLHSLSRRLALDFSDLFQQGLGFDRIDGTFTLEEGHAYTNDLLVEAPAARIEINGRIGLEDQDYDQFVTVTPQVGSVLPIAGTIAGGPAVGAALFFAERLLRQEIDQVTRYQYSVTGPWHAPVVERIGVFARSASPPEHNNRR